MSDAKPVNTGGSEYAKPVNTDGYEPYVAEGRRRPEPLMIEPVQFDVIGGRPRPTLPNPGRTSNGYVFCNAALPGAPGVFCDRLVKRYADGSVRPHRRRRHRFEWSD